MGRREGQPGGRMHAPRSDSSGAGEQTRSNEGGAQVTRGGGGEQCCAWPPTWRRRELGKEDPLPAYSGGQEQR